MYLNRICCIAVNRRICIVGGRRHGHGPSVSVCVVRSFASDRYRDGQTNDKKIILIVCPSSNPTTPRARARSPRIGIETDRRMLKKSCYSSVRHLSIQLHRIVGIPSSRHFSHLSIYGGNIVDIRHRKKIARCCQNHVINRYCTPKNKKYRCLEILQPSTIVIIIFSRYRQIYRHRHHRCHFTLSSSDCRCRQPTSTTSTRIGLPITSW